MNLIKKINSKLILPIFEYYKIYIQTLPLILNIILIIALLSIFIANPDGKIFEKTYYNISLSFIASYIFFVIVVHSKELKDRERMNCFIELHIWRIINDYKIQVQDLNKNANKLTQKDYFTIDEFENLLDAAKINGKSTLIKILNLEKPEENIYLNWHEYFVYKRKESIDEINIIINLPFLDVQLIEILAKIRNCSHFEFHGHSFPFNLNQSYKFNAEIFFKYSKLIEHLEKYYIKYLSKYNARSRI
jgi:hypothetical protein